MEEGHIVTLKTPWTKYRSVLRNIASHLKQNGNIREDFKGFFYRSIPSSSFENPDVFYWLIKMEQTDLINIDNLDVLELFYAEMTDTEMTSTEILQKIREFKLWMLTIHKLTDDYPELKELLYSPPIKKFTFTVSKELCQLFEHCRNRKRNGFYLTLIELIDIYSLAIQRVTGLRPIPGRDLRDLLCEYIAVTDNLMLELSESLSGMNDRELVEIFGWKLLLRHEP